MLRGRAALLAASVLIAAMPGCGDDEPTGKAMQVGAREEAQPSDSGTPAPSGPAGDVMRRLRDNGIAVSAQHTEALCEGAKALLIEVPGDRAIDAWELARNMVEETGHWPVVMGPDDDVGLVRDTVEANCEEGHSPAKELRAAERLDLADVLEKRRRYMGVGKDDLRVSRPVESAGGPPEFSANTDVTTGRPLNRVWLGLVPTRRSWQVPAYLLYGYWNDTPDPAVHAALHREWERRYGSEIVSMAADVVETRVTRPPSADGDVAEVAREQYLYAPDIVDQGLGDVDELAAILKNGRSWYFWFD